MPFHFGSAGPVQGGSDERLGSDFGRAKRHDHGSQGAVPATLSRAGCRAGPRFEEWIKKHVPEGGPPNLHPEQPPPGASASAELLGGHGQHGKIDRAMIGEGIQSTNQRRHSYVRRSRRSRLLHRSRVSASAARLARSRARNGTKCRTTVSPGREIPMTTPAISAPRPGDMSCSSSKIDRREIRSPARCR